MIQDRIIQGMRMITWDTDKEAQEVVCALLTEIDELRQKNEKLTEMLQKLDPLTMNDWCHVCESWLKHKPNCDWVRLSKA